MPIKESIRTIADDMEKYIKCRNENGYFIFDTIERYPENVANDILDEFIKQNLEAISYKIADHPWFQITGRISERYLNILPGLNDSDSVLVKTNTIKDILELKMEELVFSNPE
jgi:hypothetical protein